MPARESRPNVGFKPKMPQNDDGTRIEPLVSDPSAIGTKPPPTAQPDPPEDPPGVRPRSHGLPVTP